MQVVAPATLGARPLVALPFSRDLFSEWEAYLDRKPRTVKAYTQAARSFYEWVKGEGIARPARADVIAYKQSLLDSGKAAATVRAYIIALRLFFRWAASVGSYPNIADNIKPPKVEKYFHRDHLTKRQVKRLLATCDRATEAGARDYALLALMVTTGLRTIEIARADVGDIRPAGDFTALYVQGKGRDDRAEYVKLADSVEDALRDYLTYRGEGTGPLFTSTSRHNQGGRLTTRSISRIAKQHLKRAGLNSPRLTAHSLRHTAAHLMLDAGEPIGNVQRVLRHKDAATTMIYLAERDRSRNNAELKAARAIFGRG